MLFIVEVVVVFLSVFGGYAAIGGRLDILWQPFEAVIICVATAGAYVIANPMPVLTRTMGAIIGIIKGPRYNKDNYIELLSMMYQLFRLAKTKGLLALETHIENPDESELFAQFPSFHANHHVLLLLCDYLRMISLGTDKPHEIEALMDEEIRDPSPRTPPGGVGGASHGGRVVGVGYRHRGARHHQDHGIDHRTAEDPRPYDRRRVEGRLCRLRDRHDGVLPGAVAAELHHRGQKQGMSDYFSPATVSQSSGGAGGLRAASPSPRPAP